MPWSKLKATSHLIFSNWASTVQVTVYIYVLSIICILWSVLRPMMGKDSPLMLPYAFLQVIDMDSAAPKYWSWLRPVMHCPCNSITNVVDEVYKGHAGAKAITHGLQDCVLTYAVRLATTDYSFIPIKLMRVYRSHLRLVYLLQRLLCSRSSDLRPTLDARCSW